MARIHRSDLADVLPLLPEISPYKPEDDAERQDDLYLCALGFEGDRLLEIPQRLASVKYKAYRSIYFLYKTNLDDNAARLPDLMKHLVEISGSDIVPIDVPGKDFVKRLVAQLKNLEERHDRKLRVTLDLSTAANRLVVKVVKVLVEYGVELRVVYTEAEVYRPLKEEYEKNKESWKDEEHLGIEQGVLDEEISSETQGVHTGNLPQALILYSSFNPARSRAVINKVDPSLIMTPSDRVWWIVGVPHDDENRWRSEAVRYINQIDNTHNSIQASTFDYKNSMRSLHQIVQRIWKTYHIFISPLGSKMQSLGVALYCLTRNDIGLLLVRPKEYKALGYSTGCRDTWQIEFGDTSAILSNLRRVGKIEVKQ